MIGLLVTMLHDDERQTEFLRQARDQLAQRGQTTPRGPDDDDVVRHVNPIHLGYLTLR